jgi:uncharacterized coiled-coil protein SlyX
MTTPFVYDSEESFLEMLRKFYKYLHELTEATKSMSDDIIELRSKMTSFEEEVNQMIQNINDLLVEYDMKIERVADDLKVYVDNKIINLRNYVDSQDSLLDARIRDIEIGKINVYDPTTGLFSPIQTVIDNLYDMNRANALTATEYDALELSATDFDAYEITAREYDINAKSLLI